MNPDHPLFAEYERQMTDFYIEPDKQDNKICIVLSESEEGRSCERPIASNAD